MIHTPDIVINGIGYWTLNSMYSYGYHDGFLGGCILCLIITFSVVVGYKIKKRKEQKQ